MGNHFLCHLVPALIQDCDRHTFDLRRDGIAEEDDQDNRHQQQDHHRPLIT